MGKYALIVSATGAVDNVIEYDGSSPFTPPTGMELREAGENAEYGGTWNGSAFVRAVAPTVPTDEARTRVLLVEITQSQKYDEDTYAEDADGNVTNDGMIDKTVNEIAAEKAEMIILLKAELAAGDLDNQRTQVLLRLQNEIAPEGRRLWHQK